MKKSILMVSGLSILGALFAFGYVLYRVGEEMMMTRCGCRVR